MLVTLDVDPARAEEFAALLAELADQARSDPHTVTWTAFRVDVGRFGLFETFVDADARTAHMTGPAATEAAARMADFLVGTPGGQTVDVIGGTHTTMSQGKGKPVT